MSIVGRTETRRRIGQPLAEMFVYDVVLDGVDAFVVVANCEAMVRLVVIDRRRIKQTQERATQITAIGPAMTAEEL